MLPNEFPGHFGVASVILKFPNEGFLRLVGGDDEILLDSTGCCHLVETALLFIDDSDIGYDESRALKCFLNCIPNSISAIMEFYSHPMIWFQNTITAYEALFHQRLVFN